jgi:coatomer protein complex subunit gamma
MAFLSTNLREDGTADFKKDLVDALILIITQVPAAREVGLLHLCEFIEDCEYPSLCTRTLGFLGEEVPSTAQPSKYVRFIYNRLILENALVRGAAVDALAKIAMKCPALRRDVKVLLEFGQNDNDDEVRDRISLYSGVLQKCIDEGGEDAGAVEGAKAGFQSLVSTEMPFSMDALYDSLLDHMTSENKENLFDVSVLPTEEAYKAAMKAGAAAAAPQKKPGIGAPAAPAKQSVQETAAAVAEQRAAANTELLRAIGEIVSAEELGPLQHSCSAKYLTESEAEYTVQVTKHMFKQHMVLDMYVSNTVQGVALENIEVRLTGVESSWTDLGASMITRLEYNQQASAHVVLRKKDDSEAAIAVTGSVGAALHFLVKEEGDDLGYEDDYPIESIVLTTGDYMFPRGLPQGQFKSGWESLAAQGVEATQKLSLNFKTLEAAVDGVAAALNMQPCDNTARAEAGVKVHTLLMSGVFVGGTTVLVKALVGMDPAHGCVAKLSCRSKSANACELVSRALI